jgi:hypothetical protein
LGLSPSWTGNVKDRSGLHEPIGLSRDLFERKSGGPMASVWQWLGVGFGLGIIALGLSGFFRGLSLPPNPPEQRAQEGKERYWRT